MKLLNLNESKSYTDEQKVKAIRSWRTSFYGIADSLAVVEDFLTNPEAYEGDENKLQGVFNNIELVKDLASTERQKAACAAATDMLFDIAGHAF